MLFDHLLSTPELIYENSHSYLALQTTKPDLQHSNYSGFSNHDYLQLFNFHFNCKLYKNEQ